MQQPGEEIEEGSSERVLLVLECFSATGDSAGYNARCSRDISLPERRESPREVVFHACVACVDTRPPQCAHAATRSAMRR